MIELQAMLEKQLTPERALRAAVALVIYHGLVQQYDVSSAAMDKAFTDADAFLAKAFRP